MKTSLKILFILIIVLFNFGCEKVVLKKTSVAQIPFKWTKGNLKIQLYRIAYPSDILEKERFYNELDIFSTKLYLYKNKVSIVFNEDFLKDYESVKKGEYISGEEVLYKVASSLTEVEKQEIKRIVGKSVEQYKNTVQEYLNLQIYFWIKISGDETKYDETKLYTELDKEEIINRVKIRRMDLIKKIAKLNLEIVSEMNDFYNVKNQKKEYKNYYMTKDIVFSKTYLYDLLTSKISYPVYITNLKKEDIEKIVKEKISFKNKCVIIKNEFYSGYKIDKNDIILFYGGTENIGDYKEYKIDIEVIDSDWERLININNSSSLGTIFGGK